jgi:hypothetical protein
MSKKVLQLYAVIAVLVTGCGGGPASPPLVYLVTASGLVDGFQSSYCWDGGAGGTLCVDTIAPTFSSPTSLPAGDPIQFQFDTPLPDEVVLSASKELFGETIYSESKPAAELITWSTQLPPGEYILAVHVTWKQGSVSYWYSVSLE